MTITRTWSARATPEGARAYTTYFRDSLVPQLAGIAGHRGALVLERSLGEIIEITVHTFWESMAAVERFAGPRHDEAVVEPEPRAMLTSFDDRVEHREVVLDVRAGS